MFSSLLHRLLFSANEIKLKVNAISALSKVSGELFHSGARDIGHITFDRHPLCCP